MVNGLKKPGSGTWRLGVQRKDRLSVSAVWAETGLRICSMRKERKINSQKKKKGGLGMVRFAFVVLAVLIFVSSAHANWLQRALEGALQNAGERAIYETVDGAYDAGKRGVKDSVMDQGEQGSGREPAPKFSPRTTEPSERTSASASGGQDLIAAEKIYNKYDFIPGDRTIFFDDFSDTDVGEFPRKWKLKKPNEGGPYGKTGVEVVEYQSRKFMRSVPTTEEMQPPSVVDIRFDIPKNMPEKFTIEFDAVLGLANPDDPHTSYVYKVCMYNNDTPQFILNDSLPAGIIEISGEMAGSLNTSINLKKSDQKVHRVSISVNRTFVKAYIDHERVINDPDALSRPVRRIGLMFGNRADAKAKDIMITNFRIAEGGKDIKSALDTDGKIVTHGILFDTGSDRIKPESLPTLKMILKLLQDNASLKFSVEGHTDNQGGVTINQPLSEKRAYAVKAWLEGKGIAANRLTAKGWGQEKPMDTNGTAEGRANNRRVEFIKIK